MRRRHKLLAAASLLAPAACSQPAPAAHRSTAGPNTATSPTGPASSSTEAAQPRPAPASVDATTTTEPAQVVTITAPPAAPATTRRAATTTTTVAPFVLPERAEDDLSDEEWEAKERGQVARVSWYGSESGSHTANGERYDPTGLTFAHRSMAFGSLVRFCGPSGCVVARCSDRGPAAWTGKTFDLSQAAFARVAPLSAGVATVTWEVVG